LEELKQDHDLVEIICDIFQKFGDIEPIFASLTDLIASVSVKCIFNAVITCICKANTLAVSPLASYNIHSGILLRKYTAAKMQFRYLAAILTILYI
jgi:hypothetical protein